MDNTVSIDSTFFSARLVKSLNTCVLDVLKLKLVMQDAKQDRRSILMGLYSGFCLAVIIICMMLVVIACIGLGDGQHHLQVRFTKGKLLQSHQGPILTCCVVCMLKKP